MKPKTMNYILWLGSAVVFVTLAVMFFMDSINIFALVAFIVGIFFVMGYSWYAFKWYYGRKGDVQ